MAANFYAPFVVVGGSRGRGIDAAKVRAAPSSATHFRLISSSLGLEAGVLAGPGAGLGQRLDTGLGQHPSAGVDAALRVLFLEYRLDDSLDSKGTVQTAVTGRGVKLDTPIA